MKLMYKRKGPTSGREAKYDTVVRMNEGVRDGMKKKREENYRRVASLYSNPRWPANWRLVLSRHEP